MLRRLQCCNHGAHQPFAFKIFLFSPPGPPGHHGPRTELQKETKIEKRHKKKKRGRAGRFIRLAVFVFSLRLPARACTVYGIRPAGSPDRLFFLSRRLVRINAGGLKHGSTAPRAMATTFFSATCPCCALHGSEAPPSRGRLGTYEG